MSSVRVVDIVGAVRSVNVFFAEFCGLGNSIS